MKWERMIWSSHLVVPRLNAEDTPVIHMFVSVNLIEAAGAL